MFSLTVSQSDDHGILHCSFGPRSEEECWFLPRFGAIAEHGGPVDGLRL